MLGCISIFLFCLSISFVKTHSTLFMWFSAGLSMLSLILIAGLSEHPIKKKVDLGYEQIIAYVDLSITTEEQVKEKYEIISKNGDVYTLREKKEITEDDVQNEHVHQWEVTDINKKKDGTEYTIECKECKQKRQISN